MAYEGRNVASRTGEGDCTPCSSMFVVPNIINHPSIKFKGHEVQTSSFMLFDMIVHLDRGHTCDFIAQLYRATKLRNKIAGVASVLAMHGKSSKSDFKMHANDILDGCPDLPMRRAVLEGKDATHRKVKGHSAVSPAKTAEPINMPFGAWTRVEPWEPSGEQRIRWECTLAPHGEYD